MGGPRHMLKRIVLASVLLVLEYEVLILQP